VGVPFSALTPLPDATIRSLDPPELRDLPSDGSFLFTSGATALKPAPGMLAVAATNAAVHAITAGLAVELAPIRVNAIAPGTIDTGAYDALGDERKAAVQSPVRGQSQAGPAPFLAYLAARRGGTSARLFRWRESGW
jgi:NAD(P)-dependent dehydrogenase (short-subunit alcohol dehydrogenase family)